MQHLLRDTYVARQPIFNTKKQTLGYELLFRDGEHNAYPTHVGSNRATYRLIVENFLSIGTNPIRDNSRCFINFPYESLIRGLPHVLPKDKIVVEILETCTPDDALLLAVKKLHAAGFLLALDDFIYDLSWKPFLPYIHIVKLDVMAMGIDAACDFVRQRKSEGVKRKYLAERVESEAEYVAAKAAGFSFFQGYFFSKPQMVKQNYLGPEQLIAMELFREVSSPEVDFEKVEKIVAKDVALSYKLLRFVNTMSDRLTVPISSFRQALVYLGEDRLKTFVSLAVASYISVKKPTELYHLSLQRAQFFLLMARDNPFYQYRDQAFLIGLFSMLDALLDMSLENIISQLPLCATVKSALLDRRGPFGLLLNLAESYEQANWEDMELLCGQLDLSIDDVMPRFSQAQKWTQNLVSL